MRSYHNSPTRVREEKGKGRGGEGGNLNLVNLGGGVLVDHVGGGEVEGVVGSKVFKVVIVWNGILKHKYKGNTE